MVEILTVGAPGSSLPVALFLLRLYMRKIEANWLSG